MGFTSEAIFFRACNASLARGKSARCEKERTKGSSSDIVTEVTLRFTALAAKYCRYREGVGMDQTDPAEN